MPKLRVRVGNNRLKTDCLAKTSQNVETIGGLAQLGERLHGMQEVSGSIPLSSNKSED